MPEKGSIFASRAFPDFSHDSSVGFGECFIADPGSNEGFRVVSTRGRIVDDTVFGAVGWVAGGDGSGGGSVEFGF